MAGKFKPNRPVMAPKPKPIVEESKDSKQEEVYKDAEIEGAGHLNIRSTPEQKDGNIIGIFPDKTPCKVLANSNGSDWYRIIVGDPEIKGFAMKKYIKIK